MPVVEKIRDVDADGRAASQRNIGREIHSRVGGHIAEEKTVRPAEGIDPSSINSNAEPGTIVGNPGAQAVSRRVWEEEVRGARSLIGNLEIEPRIGESRLPTVEEGVV